MRNVVFPCAVRKGGKIAIISPATTVRREYVEGAAALLERHGYQAVTFPSALGPECGSFAASHQDRLTDLRDALRDPEIEAVLCARGGYGCVHLIADPSLPELVRAHPKWIAGFSDVSALHALWNHCGIASLHSPMAKHLATCGDDACTMGLLGILAGNYSIDCRVDSHPLNRCGTASGELRGGNLAVLNGLADTPFDLLSIKNGEDVILFIEDISEAIYAVERMMMRLLLSGNLSRVKGLIVGQFTEYRPDRNFNSMEEMISALLLRYGVTGIPVAFNFPAGHVDHNIPLIEGAAVTLNVADDTVTLTSIP